VNCVKTAVETRHQVIVKTRTMSCLKYTVQCCLIIGLNCRHYVVAADMKCGKFVRI